ncbi:TadE family type IV pilus minor pilin [Paeniglutamicibacter sp. NPDC012692]|uniref:TadE family type IV pilus minor pilin n=1 Tax=Paeniglutamicibacter sp. NPDC012692 TaxID=3364388 RepID=UPI0036C7100C
MPTHPEAGSSTAEVAVLLPAVALLLTVVAAAGMLGGEQVRIQQAASAAARELARGTDAGEAIATALRIGGTDLHVTLGSGAGYAKVFVASGVALPLLGEIRLTAEASARKETEP